VRVHYLWRLLGGNNRELGRSARQFDEVDQCEQALRLLKCDFPMGLLPDIALDPTTRRWSWRLLQGDHPMARSSRPFVRQHECWRNLEQFIDRFKDTSLPISPRP
jgi:hypothetical protein